MKRYCGAIVGIFCLLLGACASYTKSESGEANFWGEWMNKNITTTPDAGDTEESWGKFEQSIHGWLSNRMGRISKTEILKYFPKPNRVRGTGTSSAVSWYFTETRLKEWDLFVPFGQSSLQNGFVLAFGFDSNDILRHFEVERVQNPSESFGLTSKNVAQVAVTYLSYGLLINMADRALDRAVDKADRKLTQHEDSIINKVKEGLSNSFNGLSGKDVTVSGEINGQPVTLRFQVQ